ncbi:pyridoxamine 5'-phosphate oxidase family protein [Halorussus salilacus]|uniref:pyridoxamine 5'-phosphate oxidase family protein n=1 Tax=Halorussus salilacus TaxID=2953750 RepID=UPI0020A09284|nr:pyridoxamine 5'-phosphate oxidase family protein [Halorussus salilacus]USZ68720.1 pyridoxamine 5'-phosphate oxidase family protein [Halorussus salilacus]
MDESEIDSFLREQDSGTLSLTNGEETYAIPESFGYDGENLYFHMAYTTDSQKMEFIETTEVATFTTYREDTSASSVIARGEIERVPESDEILASRAFADNTVVPVLNVSIEESIDQLDFDFYRLRPTELTGRKFGDNLGRPDRTEQSTS